MAVHTHAISVRPIRLTPTEAELAIEMRYPHPQPTTELRGRLMGPICPYSTTIEVAYPIKMTGHGTHGSPVLHGRVLIPEPAWWDPESPFLYHGLVELWEHETRVETANLRCGLRHATWDGDRLIWNGQPVSLRSQTLTEFDEASLQSLRDGGFNSIIVPAATAKSACLFADRIGLFVISDSLVAIDGLQHPSAVPPRID